MYLVKTLSQKHRDAALKTGSIRIGTINYYRKIEDETRQDADEGLGHITWNGDVLTAETHNKLFTPFDKVVLEEGWKIQTDGIPLHGSYPNFNAYCFCYSAVKHPSEIAKTSGGKGTHYYYIKDFREFATKIRDALRPIAIAAINKYEPDLAEHLINNLEVLDVTYRVNYSDRPKMRIVNENNVEDFDPMAFHSQDFFQKSTAFSYEQEVRTIWFFLSKRLDGSKLPLSFPPAHETHINLELGNLPISKKRSRNRVPIKLSPLKAEGA